MWIQWDKLIYHFSPFSEPSLKCQHPCSHLIDMGMPVFIMECLGFLAVHPWEKCWMGQVNLLARDLEPSWDSNFDLISYFPVLKQEGAVYMFWMVFNWIIISSACLVYQHDCWNKINIFQTKKPDYTQSVHRNENIVIIFHPVSSINTFKSVIIELFDHLTWGCWVQRFKPRQITFFLFYCHNCTYNHGNIILK